ncbi:MAG TPA: winged-helix domain-containing protein, partial [Pedococcus sp.]|nr:winged-helix domain-containing protein [Pedococcus sp.]
MGSRHEKEPGRPLSADPTSRRGIPDATVARLPEYLRALTGFAERGITS